VRDVVRLGGIAHWRLPEPTRNKFVNEATAFGNLPRYQQVWLSLLGRAPKLGPVKTYVVVGGGVYRNGVLSHMLGMIQSRLLQEGDELSLSGFLIPPTGNPA
jgi:hypothetical protein